MTTGAVVWFTGLPASGKTTLATRVRAALAAPGVPLAAPCVLLDSDEVRAALDLASYAADDRDAFYRALGALAALLARQDMIVLVAATAPRRSHRDHARTLAPRFLEVYVRTDAATCEQRDVKGLYARARRGDAPTLPGVGAPYEPPLAPDVVAEGGEDLAAVEAILARSR